MKRFRGAIVSIVFGVGLILAAAAGAMVPNETDGGAPAAQAGIDTGRALVQLIAPPLSTASATKPAAGRKIDFSSNAVKSYRAQLSAQRNDFKAWLRSNAPGVQVTGEFDIALNAVSVKLNGTALGALAAAPMVQHVEYQGTYTPAAKPSSNDPDLSLISAPAAWSLVGGPANAGAGVKVGIIDTGIDVDNRPGHQTHPCFDDAGYPLQQQLGDTRFTNNKVIVAKVFYNKADVQGLSAEAVQEHGSHVAGTVACNYQTPAMVDGVLIPYAPSGVAPKALLGNYNVFPGNVGNARSEDILNALEAAYQDGMDVVNMSLGGGASGIQDLLTNAVNDLDEANMVSAIAAGNEGPGHYTVSSPGSAERALTAGASTVGHGLVTFITVDGTKYQAAKGAFGTPPAGGLTATLQMVPGGDVTSGGLSFACSGLSNLAGRIALISRGSCTFSMKIRNVRNAGAVGAIVVDRTAEALFTMAQDGTPDQPTTIPAYLVGLADRAALIAADGKSATLPDLATYVADASKSNWMADFSSQGPTDVDFRVKPDAVAPGVNVLSSIPGNCGPLGCWAFFQGTSMATPHLAGSAALLRGAHPTWSAAQVRSAIVNTADQGVLRTSDGSALETDVNVVGAGRDNVASAVQAKVALDPVSVSFGSVPAGSGRTASATVALSTLSGPGATGLAVTDQTGAGVSFAATLSDGSVTVTMTESQQASPGNYQGTLRVYSGRSEIAHAAVYAFVKEGHK